MLTANEIRSKFLNFFEERGHKIVASAPIVLKDDPTLMFTNAGMNQFKDYFLGNKKAEFTRVADTQKCLRVSGKHNDLEEVGVDHYHHTMFEMLGNWSFGDYFKHEAIQWSWEFLTEVLGLPKDRLYASVFEGDKEDGIPPSEIALAEWKKILPQEQIIFGNKKDNFWEMGDTGPCGPCSEIHIDMRPDAERKKIPGRDLVNKDHPDVIEIWNNVFIQYNRKKDRRLEPLPDKHVDTGMGLERLVRALQGVSSNYDTDIFQPYIKKTEKLTHKKYLGTDSKVDVAFRVIADHIRAISFTIADGQLPANTGAGYVVRRILRRAVRYYYSYLDYQKPLLHELLPVLAEQFKDVFPEVKQQESFIKKVIFEEENSFLSTLEKGLARMAEVMKNAADETIDGALAFELYDTFGFPMDLTRLIAQENGFKIQEAGFEKAMTEQKTRSKAATVLNTDDWQVLDANKQNTFVGYDTLATSTQVLQYRKVANKGKEFYQIVLAETPFYAESGGQVGDKGSLRFESTMIQIFDTKKENDLILHYCKELPESLTGEVHAEVNATNRRETSAHHSATHLLHAALRKILGKHVAQKGSLVNKDHLRFDFSHIEKVSEAEQRHIEELVNQKIRENIPVVIKSMTKDEALAMGAMALFGEKYGDEVRVVIMDKNYSIELCGGTHVGYTGELGFFKIISESAIAAGVRRIEAVTGQKAEDYIHNAIDDLNTIKHQLKNPASIATAVQQLADDKSALQKEIEKLQETLRWQKVDALIQQTEDLGDITFIGQKVEASSADDVKKMCFAIKQKIDKPIVVLCGDIDGKANVCILIDDELQKLKAYSAKQWIKEIVAPRIKGGGGGQDNFASAGGQQTNQFDEIIEQIKLQLT